MHVVSYSHLLRVPSFGSRTMSSQTLRQARTIEWDWNGEERILSQEASRRSENAETTCARATCSPRSPTRFGRVAFACTPNLLGYSLQPSNCIPCHEGGHWHSSLAGRRRRGRATQDALAVCTLRLGVAPSCQYQYQCLPVCPLEPGTWPLAPGAPPTVVRPRDSTSNVA